MSNSDIAHLVFGASPNFVGFDLTFRDRAYGPVFEELPSAGQAGRDSTMAVRAGPVLHFGPTKKLDCCIRKFTDNKATRWGSSF